MENKAVEAPAETGVRERLAEWLCDKYSTAARPPFASRTFTEQRPWRQDAMDALTAFPSLSGGVLPLAERLKRLPIGDMEREAALTFFSLVKHGSKFINLHVRKDGKEYHFQADWLKALLRDLDAPSTTTQEGPARLQSEYMSPYKNGTELCEDCPPQHFSHHTRCLQCPRVRPRRRGGDEPGSNAFRSHHLRLSSAVVRRADIRAYSPRKLDRPSGPSSVRRLDGSRLQEEIAAHVRRIAPVSDAPTKLRECPFCGSPAELETDSDHHGEWFNLGCSRHWGKIADETHCIGARIFYTDPMAEMVSAIAKWNQRAALTESTK